MHFVLAASMLISETVQFYPAGSCSALFPDQVLTFSLQLACSHAICVICGAAGHSCCVDTSQQSCNMCMVLTRETLFCTYLNTKRKTDNQQRLCSQLGLWKLMGVPSRKKPLVMKKAFPGCTGGQMHSWLLALHSPGPQTRGCQPEAFNNDQGSLESRTTSDQIM